MKKIIKFIKIQLLQKNKNNNKLKLPKLIVAIIYIKNKLLKSFFHLIL